MSTPHVEPLSQQRRPPCSLPLDDADLSLGNANWTKGLQAMTDWIWSGHLNPKAFPNHLARYFLHIPGIFEQQLHYSTSLIFDEPSFRNGVQVSGFLDRVCRELAISLIAQRRRCWYSMTHHAILGHLTATRHRLSDQQFADKWANLTQHRRRPEPYTRLERAVLAFADAFCTNPKAYTDTQYRELRAALEEDNQRRYAAAGLFQARLDAARLERARALNEDPAPRATEIDQRSRAAAAGVAAQMPGPLNERKVDAQVVELAFICVQFVALSGVFSALNIPDEDFLAPTMEALLPAPVIRRINELNEQGLRGEVPELVPGPPCEPFDLLRPGGRLFEAIRQGAVVIAPPTLKANPPRLVLEPYEGAGRAAFTVGTDYDRGQSVAGVMEGVFGWSFGGHFPGGLIYLLMKHPELARYEARYANPLLFNQDEWRNGVQTAGFASRRLKELCIQKVYRNTRSRYGLEHHTMYLYNTYHDEHGANLPPTLGLAGAALQQARARAAARAEQAALYMHAHNSAPPGVYTDLERAVLSWADAIQRRPHQAHTLEPAVRAELERENRREIEAGTRRLDRSPGLGERAALERLAHHQIAELAMLISHMDGLGRALTMLRVEAEEPVQVYEQDADGTVRLTGYFNDRPGLHQIWPFIGVSNAVLTLNEVLLNPTLATKILAQLDDGQTGIDISADTAAGTGEF